MVEVVQGGKMKIAGAFIITPKTSILSFAKREANDRRSAFTALL
jgi:hypothetical protein